MAWRRMRNVTLALLSGGFMLQTTGCETTVASTAANLVSSYITSYITELLLSGFAT